MLRDYLVSFLETIGVVREAAGGSGTRIPENKRKIFPYIFIIDSSTSKARTALQNAENELRTLRKEKESAQKDIARLFDPEWYGSEGEWKKLDGQCLSKDTGEYTYEVCMFGEARQKPNKGGSTHSLGYVCIFTFYKPNTY